MTQLQTLTFEHRQENKSCSAYPKDQHKHVTNTDTVTATLVPSFCHVDIFFTLSHFYFVFSPLFWLSRLNGSDVTRPVGAAPQGSVLSTEGYKCMYHSENILVSLTSLSALGLLACMALSLGIRNTHAPQTTQHSEEGLTDKRQRTGISKQAQS